MKEKPLDTIIKSNTHLNNIIARAKLIKKIECLIRAELSLLLCPSAKISDEHTNMINAVHVANYQHCCLKLICDNAAVTTRLRFFIPQLTQQLRSSNQLPGLANITFKTGHITKIISPETLHSSSRISLENSLLLKNTIKALQQKN